MPERDVVVIGGSLGSHEVLRKIVRSLPEDLRAMVFVAIHRNDLNGPDYLPVILSRLTRIPVVGVRERQGVEAGRIYIAPGVDRLAFQRGAVLIERSAGSSSRGSIDAMFRSAAQAYGERVIGVILSGMLDDGTVGFGEIRRYGGVTITQDPNEAEQSSMPQSAMQRVAVDYCLPAAEIGPKLGQLLEGSTSAPVSASARVMIVEDQWLFASDLKKELTELRYEVVAMAASGEEAMAQVESARPDVAIMDVGLAGEMRGTETARRLWEQYGIPIVYLTAHMDQATVLAAESSMPYAFLPKPHLAGHLHATIQLVLGRRRQERERGG